jgi:predicted nucleotidyltransferase component of viral defense system
VIPRRYIAEWRQQVNWIENIQVEQDLIIARALVEIYSDTFLAERLAFRGGTALHKLFVQPPARYTARCQWFA